MVNHIGGDRAYGIRENDLGIPGCIQKFRVRGSARTKCFFALVLVGQIRAEFFVSVRVPDDEYFHGRQFLLFFAVAFYYTTGGRDSKGRQARNGDEQNR